MFHDAGLALWFFLPAGIGNAAPIIAAQLPILSRMSAPIDAGLTFRGKRFLGSHKTWRGVVSGIIAATLALELQRLIYDHSMWVRSLASPVDYHSVPVFLLGPLFALGALGGDAAKSFFKRQASIPPGRSWFPFDQTDYIVGASIATAFVLVLPLATYLWALVLWVLIHIISSAFGYVIQIKERPI